MVIDHINNIWLHDSVMLMELIGRGTFPLFCYALAVAALKVEEGGLPKELRRKKIRRYAGRLLILALVSQPFFYWTFNDLTANVIFTLTLGLVFAALSFRARLWQMYALYILALVSMLWNLPLEFGLAGVMVPSAIVLVRRGNKSAWPFLLLLLFFMNAGGVLGGIRAHADIAAWAMVAFNGLASIVLPWLVLDMARQIRKTQRFMPKYALYIFYPAHLVVLKLAAILVT